MARVDMTGYVVSPELRAIINASNEYLRKLFAAAPGPVPTTAPTFRPYGPGMRALLRDAHEEDSFVWWGGRAARLKLDGWLTERAIIRLARDEVTATQYGVRCELNCDLGDDRLSAKAYWPRCKAKPYNRCQCFRIKQHGECSHTLAARILDEHDRTADPTAYPQGAF